MFGIDGVLLALILTFIILFAAILSGFPVAFAIGGAGVVSFVLVALLDSAGLLVHSLVDVSSPEYKELLKQGVARLDISKFSYPDLPRVTEPVFPGGWEKAVNRTLSFVVNRVNERVIAGQSIETLLAILMFVLMGITLERPRFAVLLFRFPTRGAAVSSIPSSTPPFPLDFTDRSYHLSPAAPLTQWPHRPSGSVGQW